MKAIIEDEERVEEEDGAGRALTTEAPRGRHDPGAGWSAGAIGRRALEKRPEEAIS